MRPVIAAMVFAPFVLFTQPAAHAQTSTPDSGKASSGTTRQPSAKQQAQRDRMKSCNDEAGDRKGDERKKFMSSCLAGNTPAGQPTAQQQKMKDCNREASAKSLKGDERKKFMSGCLKSG